MNNLGKVMMSVAIAIFSFIPPLADLATTTHVFHPDWTPHARLHTVWLLGLTSSIGLFALYQLWFSRSETMRRINLAGTLALCVYGSFFLSAFTMKLYGGSLSDVHGGVEAVMEGVDANVLTFSFATLLLLLGWFLCIKTSRA